MNDVVNMKRILCVSCAIVLGTLVATPAVSAPSVTAKENLAQLVATKKCPGCDLSEINFNRMDLSHANLQGADLSSSTFFLTNLSYANLRDTILNGAVFGGADLGDADLTGADLRGVSLDSAYLGGTKMTGEMVTTHPLEKLGVDEAEKDVYVESQAIPKQPPPQKEVQVSERRDFGETPPVIVAQPEKPVEQEEIISPVETSAPPENTVPKAPLVKKSVKVEQVSVPVVEEKTVVKEEAVTPAMEKESVTAANGDEQKSVMAAKTAPVMGVASAELEPEKVEKRQKVEDQVVATVDQEKMRRLETLLDTKSCYGCDLSGLDLSKKNLKKADLEKADLSGCNLTKTNLKNANLKGAILVNANLKKAKLDNADLYKANLRGADLSGASQEDISIDGAQLDDVIGLDMPLMLQN